MCTVCEAVKELADEGREPSEEQRQELKKSLTETCVRCGKHEPLAMAMTNPPGGERHAEGLPLFRMTACLDCGFFLKLPGEEPRTFGEDDLEGLSPRLAYYAGRMHERGGHAVRKRREDELFEALSKSLGGALDELRKRDAERVKARAAARGAAAPEAPPAE